MAIARTGTMMDGNSGIEGVGLRLEDGVGEVGAVWVGVSVAVGVAEGGCAGVAVGVGVGIGVGHGGSESHEEGFDGDGLPYPIGMYC
jgi:hypothetical protein